MYVHVLPTCVYHTCVHTCTIVHAIVLHNVHVTFTMIVMHILHDVHTHTCTTHMCTTFTTVYQKNLRTSVCTYTIHTSYMYVHTKVHSHLSAFRDIVEFLPAHDCCTCMYVCSMYTCTCTCTYMYVCMYVYMYVCMYVMYPSTQMCTMHRTCSMHISYM